MWHDTRRADNIVKLHVSYCQAGENLARCTDQDIELRTRFLSKRVDSEPEIREAFML